MRKNKIWEKFKKILIIFMCFSALFFSMPVKSDANAITDAKDDIVDSIEEWVENLKNTMIKILVNIITWIEDAPMSVLHKFIGNSDNDNVEFKLMDIPSNYEFSVTPATIFYSGIEKDGEVILPLLDCNFFRNTNDDKNSADILRPTISAVYRSLRNIIMIIMLVILLYIGVRIVLATVASDKSKYKQILGDWVIGICLLVCMQYIMSFCMTVNQLCLKILGSNDPNNFYIGYTRNA